MKILKIRTVSFSLLILAVFAFPCVAQNISKEKNMGTAPETNEKAVQQQNQGEEQEIQNQAIEQAGTSQDPDIGDNDNGKNKDEIGIEQIAEENNGNDSEKGKKVQNQIDQNQKNPREQRRSRVANAVHEMLAVAERNSGIGQQIRTIAQNQNQEQEEMESALQTTKKRSGIVKFFIGPNYKELKKVEDRLENNKNRLAKLKELRVQLESSADAEILTQQIQIMEQIEAELENEARKEKKGISLFGWLFRWMAK
ncbi:MAG: hypothetical protein KAS78_02490 [Candidatus Pacebacteria bacterium]|nr:hypothetical protein [Candidatus Paceibacterota bacterium]